MLEHLFLQEIFSSKLLLHESGLDVIENIVRNVENGREIEQKDLKTANAAGICVPQYDSDSGSNPYDEFEENSIAIIPISGLMLKSGYWWRYGCDDYANLIRLADSSPKITGTVLLFNTPGGTTSSIIQLEDALRNRTKKSVALVDYMCCSAGMYVASFCDEIYAMNRMCIVGSIGAYAEFLDVSKANEKYGYRIIQIYPPESKYKNLPEREALKGKDERIIKEQLTPYAIHFQNIIKENRPGLDKKAEGILEGKVFYAFEAVKNGLVDGIMNLDQTVERLKTLIETQQTHYSLLK
jgi:protease-4